MKIAFIGAGSMAEAIIAGLLKQGICAKEDITVTNKQDQQRLESLKDKYGVTIMENKEAAVKGANVIFLAMKPKDAKDGIQAIKSYVTKDQLIVSVLAGISTDVIQDLFEQELRVIRSMPNTSAAIGLSATAIAKGSLATESDLTLVQSLFSAIGLCTIVEEDQLHAVTGVSGSGPAYIYYIAEAMEKAALAQGLDTEVAKKLVSQTLIGAAHMLQETDKDAEVLRREVTSPGGTTQRGISVLDDWKVSEAFENCIKGATERSREMGEELAEKLREMASN
ncbi:pyrroline-5-carboxylate reductase [Sutcliffiella horikoshii]|uniref:Pyrroline-5-carboxylate reductase n=1 Tax=Sutcliffiella horikoshii TaxID=79883 RepID=A0AA94WP07_9BACI|nr:pyrroline-5-carboxylate reductase [Sutcliffiella horikoshii]TYS57620.1 pyrroline-5-carboxylate reductase [Sutcliffiella horikoshii]